MSSDELKQEAQVPAVPVTVPIVNGMLQPTDLEGLWRLAVILSGSGMVPDMYRNKEQDTFVALSWGMELGLSANVSLQSIAVINGKPGLYGEVGMALVQNSGLLEDFEETFQGEFGHDDYKAICRVRRKGIDRTFEYEFSVADAKAMGKWNKPTQSGKLSIWQKFPKRMLQWRARWFALRDIFADVLKGLHFVEELRDAIEMEEVSPGTYATPENISEGFNKLAENSDLSTNAETHDNTEGVNEQEPSDDDYVNPGNADDAYAPATTPEPEQAVGVDDPKHAFVKIIGIDNARYGEAFAERAAQINGCPVEDIYQDAIKNPDIFKKMFDKWLAKMEDIGPKVEDTPQVTSDVPESPVIPEQETAPEQEIDPFSMVIDAAERHYGESIADATKGLLRTYMNYITTLNGMTDVQIHAGLKANPGPWFDAFGQWYEDQFNKHAEEEAAKEAEALKAASEETPTDQDLVGEAGDGEPDPPVSTEEMNANLNRPEGGKVIQDDDGSGNVVQEGNISWPAFKLKWNTMPAKFYKDFVKQHLEVFKYAETDAIAIAKRARQKWNQFYPGEVYPADHMAVAEANLAAEAEARAAGEDVDETVQRRWNYVKSKYPDQVKAALDKRKMGMGGLSRDAINLIIQDVMAAVGM